MDTHRRCAASIRRGLVSGTCRCPRPRRYRYQTLSFLVKLSSVWCQGLADAGRRRCQRLGRVLRLGGQGRYTARPTTPTRPAILAATCVWGSFQFHARLLSIGVTGGTSWSRRRRRQGYLREQTRTEMRAEPLVWHGSEPKYASEVNLEMKVQGGPMGVSTRQNNNCG